MPSPPSLPRARRRLLAAAVGVICLVPAGCIGPWGLLDSSARAASAREANGASLTGDPTAVGSTPTLVADASPALDTSTSAPSGPAATAANGGGTAGTATGNAAGAAATANDPAVAAAAAGAAATDAGSAVADPGGTSVTGDATTAAAAPVAPTPTPDTTAASATPAPAATTQPPVTVAATTSVPAAVAPASTAPTATAAPSTVAAGSTPTVSTTAGPATAGPATTGPATTGTAVATSATAAVDDQGYSTSAAVRYGWGAPERDDEFSSGVGGDWALYDGPGHQGAGRRSPTAVTTAGGVMTITGDATGTTEGMAWLPGRQYGRWETRIKTSAGDGTYHAVALLWPDAENWPVGGEVDFMENSDPTRQSTDMFLHYGADNSQVSSTVDLDATQWHDWAVEWTPDHLATFVDGVEWFRTTDIAKLPPGAMHLCLQLDWFPEGSSTAGPTTMAVDWARQYPV